MRKLAALLILGYSAPAIAGKAEPIGAGVTLTPSVDARLRYELVEQDNGLRQADAITARVRPGLELGSRAGFSLLVEGEGTLAIDEAYNSSTNGRTGYSIVADPETVEINRLQLQYRSKPLTLTVGRQRINLDDQRFVGSVAWRQNEQTFDAVRGEATLGLVALDATYAWAQRTVFGVDAGPRTAYDGDYVFLGAATGLGPVKIKGFAYLVGYEAYEPVVANATQTYGARATATFKLTPKLGLNLLASYASQRDYRHNPAEYRVDYMIAELGLTLGNYGVISGYELLGATRGTGRAFQAPLGTLHKFNGWADMFLTTPAAGLQDYYLGATARFPKMKALPGLNAQLSWHYLTSDVGHQKFGQEWDAQLGFKLLNRFGLLAKYADYDRIGMANFNGDVSTRKLWLQLDYSL